MKNNPPAQLATFLGNLRNGVWLIGIPSWLFGVTDRTIAAFADGYISAIELAQLFTAAFFLLGWLSLKPESSFNISDLGTIASYKPDSDFREITLYREPVRLKQRHMISQEYVLPFSYVCQIYHLLNLKHLEHVHYFSLGNLRIIQVTDYQPTEIGGTIKFQTVLDSSFNALRIWRQPIVEVILILHNPYTVELNIPVYNDKRIVVMFNVEPISDKEHKLFIDIYSDLNWFKPLLQILLHFAACLTLFEDLPYLQKLAERTERLVNLNALPTHETMLLFRRFVELYGSFAKPSLPANTIEST
jgi:hypothetical protein